jgi:TonB family protein
MNMSELAEIQSKKEKRTLASLLFIGFIGSTCLHAAAMITPIPALWKPTSLELDDTMEVVVDTTKTPEDKVAEIAKEPDPITPTKVEESASIEAAPIALALAPETTTPLKEGKDAAAPDSLKPMLTTGFSDLKIQSGGGPIIAKDGIGSGFGNNKIPTGFILGGKKNGNPDGKKDGVINGFINGKKDGKATQVNTFLPAAISPTPPVETKTRQLECLSCPKPQYRGKEGTPRVTYDIGADGRVSNVRLRQSSGDEQTDRETIEAMSKWQFNPQTIPEGGRANVKVRVTFEEAGSQFQRENDERRRRESEQLAEQERAERDALRSQPTPTAKTPLNVLPEKLPAASPVVSPDRIPVAAPSAPVVNNNTDSPAPVVNNTSPVPVVNNTSPPAPVVDTPPAPVVDTPPASQSTPMESTPTPPLGKK